jgi:hypothetical protein
MVYYWEDMLQKSYNDWNVSTNSRKKNIKNSVLVSFKKSKNILKTFINCADHDDLEYLKIRRQYLLLLKLSFNKIKDNSSNSYARDNFSVVY